MIQIGPNTRILVASEPVDMRNGIDGIAAICRRHLESDPMNGTVFVFINRARTHLRLLFYDGQGFWLCTKRLSKGRFNFWPKSSQPISIVAEQLSVLVRGGNAFGFETLADWRQIA